MWRLIPGCLVTPNQRWAMLFPDLGRQHLEREENGTLRSLKPTGLQDRARRHRVMWGLSSTDLLLLPERLRGLDVAKKGCALRRLLPSTREGGSRVVCGMGHACVMSHEDAFSWTSLPRGLGVQAAASEGPLCQNLESSEKVPVVPSGTRRWRSSGCLVPR